MKTLLRILMLILFILPGWLPAKAQQPVRSLVGYWQSWNDPACPYFQLTETDSRYTVICVAFALPKTNSHCEMQFIPEGISPADFKTQVEILQGLGKKVVISIGRANAMVRSWTMTPSVRSLSLLCWTSLTSMASMDWTSTWKEAPETAYVQGGMSAWGGLWGAYLPVIHALRDSLEILYVQLYNSGSMFGIDSKVYMKKPEHLTTLRRFWLTTSTY